MRLASAADGSTRDALSLLDLAIGYGDGPLRQDRDESEKLLGCGGVSG